MSKLTEIGAKICRKWMKIRLQPIRVFCFHQVSEEYNPLTMWECDWTQTEQFKRNIMHLRASGVEFVSLVEANKMLKQDWFRCRKYAVLTADDGYKSLLNIMPWLEEQQIPITLFVNTKYLDGLSWSVVNAEQAFRSKADADMLKDVCPDLYLSSEELFRVASMPNVTIGMHGHEHLDATKQTVVEFKDNVEKCQTALKNIPHTIPFFAYTWGKHNAETDVVLNEKGLIPVLVQGSKNYCDTKNIDRIAIDGKNESSI